MVSLTVLFCLLFVPLLLRSVLKSLVEMFKDNSFASKWVSHVNDPFWCGVTRVTRSLQRKGVRLSLDALLVVQEFDSMSLPSQKSCYKTLFLSFLRHTERAFFFRDSSNWPVTQII